MKLLSATVRNYRTHRDTSVRFDGSMVLVHGPNESGKSTLAEAIHCALFLKAKGNTNLHKAMQSDHGGTPEVALSFEANGRTHTLSKSFGSSGNTTLESEGQATLNGSPAEDCLAQLLGVDGTVSGGGIEGKMERRWAHLWVWQGKSNHSPLESIDESQAQLRSKLQAQSGQSFLTSDTDNAVIDALQSWESANFTQAGAPKTGSELKKAIEALEAAEARTASARTTLQELEQAATSFDQAEADIERHGKNLIEAEAQLKSIAAQLKTVGSLREQLKEKSRLREDTKKALNGLIEADTEIRQFESQLKETRAKAAPKEKEIEGLQTESKTKQADYEKARTVRERSSRELNRLRSIADAWQAHCESLRESQRITHLSEELKKIQKLKDAQKQTTKQLAPLENFTDAAIKKLAKTEREAEQARLRLETYALQIEVLESDQAIQLNDASLKPGQTEILSHAAELQIGTGTRIRLTPGGAEDLEAARADSDAAATKLSDALKALGVDSVDAAREQMRTRENLGKELEDLETKLEAANADDCEQALAEAEKTLAQLQARRDASLPKEESIPFPDEPKAAEAAAEAARASLTSAQDAAESAESQEKASHKAAVKAAAALTKAEDAHKTQSEAIKDLQSRLDYALKKSGDTDTRSNAINTATAQFDQAKQAEQSVTSQLEDLGADHLEIDAERLNHSVDADKKKLSDAKDRKIVAQTELKSNGSKDPHRELKEAEAETEQCRDSRNRLQHQSDVRRHLLDKLRAARQATTAALAKPLEDAVTPYLNLLFGGSRAQLHWAEDGSRLESFALDRTDKQKGLFSFGKLSHGTREQVALALRLAMAQLLAADHDDCLPLILDDAFTHADKNRIEKLKSLLYQASQNGLQIILLSCHPENYSGLSASEVALS